MTDVQRIYSPYTADTVPVDEDGFVNVIVAIPLNEIVYADFEGFLDILSEAVVSDALLSDISYSAYGAEDGNVLILVSGYIV